MSQLWITDAMLTDADSAKLLFTQFLGRKADSLKPDNRQLFALIIYKTNGYFY
jgi:hypothetical protein